MSARAGAAACAVVAALAVARPAHAQTSADVVDVLIDFLLKRTLQELPATAPAAKQVAAPAGANGTASISSAPSFPELVGLAFDNDMAGLKDGVFTLDLNLFAFRALANPDVEIDQTQYARPVNAALRRVGLAVSVGGQGEKFDADGDGRAEPAVPAATLTDIVTSEVRIRFAGSRDRRDPGNFSRFKAGAGAEYGALVAAVRTFLVAHLDELPRKRANALGDSALDVAKFNQFLGRAELDAEITALAAAYERYVRSQQTALAAIDRRAVWTLVVGGTRHGDPFGPDRAHVGIRGVKGAGAWDNTFNLDWRRAASFLGRPPATSWSASYEASRLLWQETLSGRGVTLAVSARVERNLNVPAAHDTIARGSVAFVVPMSAKVSVPITLSYANHADLLTAQRLWAGQVGLAWDLSGR